MSELWDWFYRLGFVPQTDRQARGLRAVKAELVYNGYTGGGIIVDAPTFGGNAATATKEFQAAHGLAADGVIGPNTARVLFRKRAYAAETASGIPGHYLAKLLHLESDDDPVAQGFVDPNDEGIDQINLPSHPGITQAEADDPSFAIPWAAGYLKGLFSAEGDWDCALAAYNLGTSLARQWCAAGKPASGGPTITVGTEQKDAWVVATAYVTLLKGEAY